MLLSNLPPIQGPVAWVIAAALGIVVGWLVTHLVAASRNARMQERLAAGQRQADDLAARLDQAQAALNGEKNQCETLRTQLAEVRTRLEQEGLAAAERQKMLEQAEARLTDVFKSLSADALKSSTEQFYRMARHTLQAQQEEARGELDKRRAAIEQMVKPVTETLGKFEGRIGEIEKAREGAYAELRTQVRAMAEAQKHLGHETGQLVKALRQPTGRGQWGEIQLLRVVEMAGMQEHCDFQTQTSSTDEDGRRLRPDMIVRLPGGKTIVVDSKTPMDAYLEAVEAQDEASRDAALQRHAQQVRTHISQLASKNYTSQFEHAPEFTVLFLPSESFFSAALQSDPGLIERGVDQGVILATPTTLIALLRAVAYGWRQEALAENAREISVLGRSLHDRLSTLGGHFAKLGKSLNSAVGHFNSAIGSYETRVLSAARKFEDLQAAPEGQNLHPLPQVEKSARLPLVSESPESPQSPQSPDGVDAEPAFSTSSPGVDIAKEKASSAANDLRSALGE